MAADKTAKATILNEFCATCSYNRKYAIRLAQCHKKTAYKSTGVPALKPTINPSNFYNRSNVIWFATDQMCSKKLKAAIPLWLPFYEQEFGPLEDCSSKQSSMS